MLKKLACGGADSELPLDGAARLETSFELGRALTEIVGLADGI
jgi:hypothetical protein